MSTETKDPIVLKIHQIGDEHVDKQIQVLGWVRTLRRQKRISFLKVYDGSSMKDLQVITKSPPEDCHTGASVEVVGKLVLSPKSEQKYEVQAVLVRMVGSTTHHDPRIYPMSKTSHSFDDLRQYPHLRIRSPTFQAVMRIRNTLSQATHRFFSGKGFQWVHTPLITGSDCEGAGEVFAVQTPQFKGPWNGFSHNPFSFFGTDEQQSSPHCQSKEAYLTVSGQLQVEAYACGGIGDVYTFGPTFRAEKSLTSRHLAEFWMIEPEMVGITLTQLMTVAELYVKACVTEVLTGCGDELDILEKLSPGLRTMLAGMTREPFLRISYTDAIQRLQDAKMEVKWGDDLSSDQEKWLVADAGRPVIVHDYPKAIKAFYMKDGQPSDSTKPTVECLDMLVPGIGELIGGSMREDDYDVLRAKMESSGIDLKEYEWYLDLRKYGSVPHGGFGLGFERLVMLCTGIQNIKDTIPFPRAYRHMTC